MNDGTLHFGGTNVHRTDIAPSPAPCSIGYDEQGAEGCGATGAYRAGRSSYRGLPASGPER